MRLLSRMHAAMLNQLSIYEKKNKSKVIGEIEFGEPSNLFKL